MLSNDTKPCAKAATKKAPPVVRPRPRPTPTKAAPNKVASTTVSLKTPPSGSKSLDHQYQVQKRKLVIMRKDFEGKKKGFMDMVKSVQQLRERLVETCGGPLPPDAELDSLLEPSFSSQPAEVLNDWRKTVTAFIGKLEVDLSEELTDQARIFFKMACSLPHEWFTKALSLTAVIKNTRQYFEETYPETNLELLGIETDEAIQEAFEIAHRNTQQKTDCLVEEINKLLISHDQLKQELRLLANTPLANELHQENKELTERINMLSKLLESETTKVTGLTNEKVELTNEISKLKSLCEELKEAVGEAEVDKNELAKIQQMCAVLEVRLQDMKCQHENEKIALTTRIGELVTENEAVKDTIKEAEKYSEDLSKKVADTEAMIRELREEEQQQVKLLKEEQDVGTELEATRILLNESQGDVTWLRAELKKLQESRQPKPEDLERERGLLVEITEKDVIIKKLKEEMSELHKAAEEYTARYNKLYNQLMEMQMRTQNKLDPITVTKEIEELKGQVEELQKTINSLVKHNSKLEETLSQQTLELDQRDRLVKQQCNLLQVRDELINLLRNKAPLEEDKERTGRPPGPPGTEHNASPCDHSNDIYIVLQDKQTQVDKLTRIVKMMEEQQDRAQQQRVRFESKIAELQVQLMDRKSKPNRQQKLFKD